MNLRTYALAGALAATASVIATDKSEAYPIDCAILLCMPGGFPASAECTAAKAEVIRRLTPIPVEPPVQPWLCPMGISAETAASLNLSSTLTANGLTKEVSAFLDAIEIYDIDFRKIPQRDGDPIIRDKTSVGKYDENGNFDWRYSAYRSGPEWLSELPGGFREPIYATYQYRDQIRSKIVGYQNSAGNLRGVAMRFKDFKGEYQTEFITW